MVEIPRFSDVIVCGEIGFTFSVSQKGAKFERKSLVSFIYARERSIRHMEYIILLINFCITASIHYTK